MAGATTHVTIPYAESQDPVLAQRIRPGTSYDRLTLYSRADNISGSSGLMVDQAVGTIPFVLGSDVPATVECAQEPSHPDCRV